MEASSKVKNPLRSVPPDYRRERDAAVAFVRTLLRSGPMRIADVYERGRAAKVPLKYLREATRLLRLERIKSGFGREGYWSWRLPAA